MARQYKDHLTLDGRLDVVPGVTKKKVQAVKALTEKHLAGDRVASATLHEALTSSDAIFNAAHLATLNFVPNYDEAERNWTKVAGTMTVPDFRPATLYSINREWVGEDGKKSRVLSERGAAPTIAEGGNYPYAYITGQSNEGGKVGKRGFKTDWTLEARINDGLGVIDRLPEEMKLVALDTEEEEVMGALIGFLHSARGNAITLAGGPIPGDRTVVANAKLSRDALIRALIEQSTRKINGRKIVVTSNNLLVPVGQKVFVDYILTQAFAKVEDGALTLNIEGYNPLANLTVIEDEGLSGEEWAIVPKPGATRRRVIDRLELRGFQTPQLFVDNHAGIPIGSSRVAPFEGSFANDEITLKLRQFGGAAVWDDGKAIVYSKGTGA